MVVIDTLPVEIQVASVTTGAYNGLSDFAAGVGVRVSYEKNTALGVFTLWGSSPNTTTSTTLTAPPPGLGAGEYITRIRWEYGQAQPGMSPSARPLITGQIVNPDNAGGPVAIGDTIQNCADLTAVYTAGPTNVTRNACRELRAERPVRAAQPGQGQPLRRRAVQPRPDGLLAPAGAQRRAVERSGAAGEPDRHRPAAGGPRLLHLDLRRPGHRPAGAPDLPADPELRRHRPHPAASGAGTPAAATSASTSRSGSTSTPPSATAPRPAALSNDFTLDSDAPGLGQRCSGSSQADTLDFDGDADTAETLCRATGTATRGPDRPADLQQDDPGRPATAAPSPPRPAP